MVIRLFNTTTSQEEKSLILDVLDSGQLVMGPHITALELELDEYLTPRGPARDLSIPGNVVCCGSGTDALVLAIEETYCVDNPNPAGFIVPAMTFSATYEAVLKAGCYPIVCDIDPETGTPTVDLIRDAMVGAIADGTPVAGVILVHLYGWPAYELEAIVDFCKAQNILLIEDCAQSFGALVFARRVGTFGDAAAFSFYPTKPLGGIGDGGAVWFANNDQAKRGRAARNHGRQDGIQIFPGYNSRLDETSAVVLRHRLAGHDENHTTRHILAQNYTANGLRAFKQMGNAIPYVNPIMVDNREKVRFKLATDGIQTGIHYDPPVSRLSYVGGKFPNAKAMSQRILSLPCHHGLTVADVDRISDAVRRA